LEQESRKRIAGKTESGKTGSGKDFDLMLDEVIEEEMSDYDKTAT